MSSTGPCPRCQKPFTCNKENIAECGCSQIRLKPATRHFLMNTFFGCLCDDCLKEIELLVEEAGRYPFPGRGGELVPDLHYYTENGYRVFTPLYLASREYCCRSGCRHCPYGFKRRHAG